MPIKLKPMKITHYLYNAFLVREGSTTIAIDPGGLFLYYLRLTSLIPKAEWPGITHLLITHGDPDHYWHADRVAEASGAAVVCNKTMVRTINGRSLLLGPRSKGLKFTAAVPNVHTIGVDETITLDELIITGLKTTHGSLVLALGPFSKTVKPGPGERVGWGAIGFSLRIAGKHIVNLGDTLLHAKEWRAIDKPDVLMIPIGGRVIHNTMDEDDALEAVSIMRPALVIPCHYNCPAFFTKNYNPADDQYFKAEAEKLGSRCVILGSGESVDLPV